MNQLRIGTNELNITQQNLHLEEPQYRANLNFYLNQTVTLDIDRSVAANVPVTLRYMTLDDELAFNRRNAQPEPGKVEIVGPGNVVSRTLSVTTVPISTSDVIDDDHVHAELEIPDGILGIRPDMVRVILESPEILTRTLPLIRINYPPERIAMIIPQTVTVKVEGFAEDVQRLRPAMISANITIPDGYEPDFAQIEIRLPDNMTLIEHTPQRVQVFYHE